MPTATVDWAKLDELARRARSAEAGPGGVVDTEWQLLEHSLRKLRASGDWEGLIRLREIFGFLVTGETTGGLRVTQALNDFALDAAEKLGDRALVARFWHDRGENLHRLGYHALSIEALERAAALYHDASLSSMALRSYFLSSLPYRALGKVAQARRILRNVLSETPKNDPWRANPLTVMAWMQRDENRFREAERLIRDALELFRTSEGDDSVHVVQTLADLGEVLGLQGKFDDAKEAFEVATATIHKSGGQFSRQEARVKLKYAEMLTRHRRINLALELLDQADDLIRAPGHYYELLLRIEYARALCYLLRGDIRKALTKFRLAMHYRGELGIPMRVFARNTMKSLLWLRPNARIF